MGCHTWYSIPKIEGKEKIIKIVQDYIDNDKHLEEDYKIIYQLAIDKELHDVIMDVASIVKDLSKIDNTWTLYKDINLSNEPRITGYPETIIRSEEEMLKAMENGLPGEDGELNQFYYDEDRKPRILKQINKFFKDNPKGVIIFG